MNLTLNFKQLNKTNADIAGGKGASLGEMTQAGIPVPPGFVVLSTTFETFIKEADLAQEIDNIIDNVNHKDINSVETASEKIQALIKNAVMPENIAKEIEEQFKLLDTEYVAVRSSATAEDGADNAWAGQLDSYLNTKKENLLEKVQHCWASLFTPRAIFYRFEKGLHTTKISVAVVVQKMVNSEISGIAFSVHPVTEDRNQMIIEAGFGLGEAIVSGQVTPDSYVVEKEPRRIIDINVNTQTRGLYRVQTGCNEWIDIPEPKASSQVLTESQILEFTDLIMRIENHYGFPCDIEWAYEKNVFYIVQSRPITTLSNKSEYITTDNKIKKVSELLSESWKDSFRWKYEAWPFFTSVYTKASLPGESRYYVQWPDFINKFENGHLEAYLPKKEIINKGQMEIQELIQGKDTFVVEFRQLLERVHKAIKNCEIIRKKNNYDQLNSWWPDVQNVLSDVAGLLFGFDYSLNDWMKEMQVSNPSLFSMLSENIRENKPSFINEATKKVVLLVKKYPKDFDRVYLEFIKDFSWFQNSYAGEFNITKEWLKKFYEENKNKVDKTLEISKKLPVEYKLLCELASEAISFRDDKKKLLLIATELMTDWLKKVCEDNSWNLEEMRWLSIDEIIEAINGEKKWINYAKKCTSENKRFGLMTLVGYSDISEDFFVKVEKVFLGLTEISELKGMTGNRGKIVGRARIILDAKKDEYKLQSGDILVTSMTRPEFLPLMNKAVAFVTDEGGITCHAAIVAREMNKPCIISTKIATQVFKDGDLVEVDADNGVVRIIKDDKKELIEKAKTLEWSHWLERPYGPFIATLNFAGVDKKYFQKIGLDDFGYEAFLYQYPMLYNSEKIIKDNDKALKKYFEKRSIFDLSNLLTISHEKNKKEIKNLIESNLSPVEKLIEVREMTRIYFPFLWIILPLEKYYNNILDREVPKYFKGNADELIGIASIPEKNNAYGDMLDMIKKGVSLEIVKDKFSWLKSRDGFTDFYTTEEFEEIKNNLKTEEKVSKVEIPKELQKVFTEIRELNFFRTARTDAYYEMLGLARPIFIEIAEYFKIPFKDKR